MFIPTCQNQFNIEYWQFPWKKLFKNINELLYSIHSLSVNMSLLCWCKKNTIFCLISEFIETYLWFQTIKKYMHSHHPLLCLLTIYQHNRFNLWIDVDFFRFWQVFPSLINWIFLNMKVLFYHFVLSWLG